MRCQKDPGALLHTWKEVAGWGDIFWSLGVWLLLGFSGAWTSAWLPSTIVPGSWGVRYCIFPIPFNLEDKKWTKSTIFFLLISFAVWISCNIVFHLCLFLSAWGSPSTWASRSTVGHPARSFINCLFSCLLPWRLGGKRVVRLLRDVTGAIVVLVITVTSSSLEVILFSSFWNVVALLLEHGVCIHLETYLMIWWIDIHDTMIFRK